MVRVVAIPTSEAAAEELAADGTPAFMPAW